MKMLELGNVVRIKEPSILSIPTYGIVTGIHHYPEDEDSSYYSENSNDEAEDAIITHLIDWYLSKYSISFFSFDNEYDLSDAIQKEYNFLSHRRRSY
jgi:hypothetical protein